MIVKIIFFGFVIFILYKFFGLTPIYRVTSFLKSIEEEKEKKEKAKNRLLKTLKEHKERSKYNDVI